MNKRTLINWALFFLLFLVISSLFNKKETVPPVDTSGAPISVSVLKNEYQSGDEVILKIRNNADKPLTIASSCPKNPFRVLAWNGTAFVERNSTTTADCTSAPSVTIPPQSEEKVSYNYWNYALFGEPGRYKVEVTLPAEAGAQPITVSTPEFTVEKAGMFKTFFRTVFYQPIYNTLILLISILPGKDLGFAIILLTLIIRVILLIPSQRALVSQRRMQELQPKLERIKKEYAGNQEKIAQETLKVWKDNKVNPFGSCLPLLVQLPVLFALFYVIQSGLNPDNTHLLYSFLKDVDISTINTKFLGILELTKINIYVLPLAIGLLQFAQLKLTFKNKKKSDEHKEKPKDDAKPAGSEMEAANRMMVYIMPVMIALFTASAPAGVGLYWGISTLFALGQQVVANRTAAAKA